MKGSENAKIAIHLHAEKGYFSFLKKRTMMIHSIADESIRRMKIIDTGSNVFRTIDVNTYDVPQKNMEKIKRI
jgi:hypothetical protein